MNEAMARAVLTSAAEARPWDVFASCHRHYWNKAGDADRKSIRTKFAGPRRAAIMVRVATSQARPLHACVRNLEEALGEHVRTIGWASAGLDAYILLNAPDPIPEPAIRATFAVDGVLSIEPDRERTAALYGIPLASSNLFDPVCAPIRPDRPGNVSNAVLENQPALAATGVQDDVGRAAARPVVVAIADNGLQWDHKYVAPHLWQNAAERTAVNCDVDNDGNGFLNDTIGWNFYDNSPDPSPYNHEEHGTQIAGLVIAVANRAGTPVRIMPLRTDGPGSRLSLAGLAQAIDYAARQLADVIVIAKSWKLSEEHGPNGAQDMRRLEQSIRGAAAFGSLIVCAAGNDRTDIVADRIQPAVLGLQTPNVLTVAGTGPEFSASNYASGHAEQLLMAPAGTDIVSIATLSRRSVRFFQTSAATAIVAGAAAVAANVNGYGDPAALKELLLRGCNASSAPGGERMLDLSCLKPLS